jgi:autotransporter adhesin
MGGTAAAVAELLSTATVAAPTPGSNRPATNNRARKFLAFLSICFIPPIYFSFPVGDKDSPIVFLRRKENSTASGKVSVAFLPESIKSISESRQFLLILITHSTLLIDQ